MVFNNFLCGNQVSSRQCCVKTHLNTNVVFGIERQKTNKEGIACGLNKFLCIQKKVCVSSHSQGHRELIETSFLKSGFSCRCLRPAPQMCCCSDHRFPVLSPACPTFSPKVWGPNPRQWWLMAGNSKLTRNYRMGAVIGNATRFISVSKNKSVRN